MTARRPATPFRLPSPCDPRSLARGLAVAGLLLVVPLAVAAGPARDASHAWPEPAARAAAERLMGAALADDHAYQRLSELCDGIGNRLSGSENLDRAVAWAAAAMREDGLANVRLQPVMIP